MGRIGLKRVTALALSPAEIAELAQRHCAEGTGSWSLGVQGAVADFAFDGDRPTVTRDGTRLEVATRRGAMRLDLSRCAAFAAGETLILAVPGPGLPAGAPGLHVAGSDDDAVDPVHRSATLVDLGLGRQTVRFCFRTDDAVLLGAAATMAGRPFPDVLAALGALLLECSPHRVVITPVGRCEVFTPIPPPGGRSPDGPHTHLLAAALATGRDLPAGLTLPDGYIPAATFHPAPSSGPTSPEP